MPVSAVVNALMYGAKWKQGWKFQSLALDLGGSGTTTSPSDPPPVLLLDAGGGAVNFDMPAEADCADQLFLIINTGGETITVRDDAAGTIIALATAESTFLFCDGTSWYLLQGAAA